MNRACLKAFAFVVFLAGSCFAGEVTVVGAGGASRKFPVFFPPSLTVEAAKQLKLDTSPKARTKALSKRITTGLNTPPPPADWAKPDFDDGAWLQWPAVDLFTGDSRTPVGWPLFQARGSDPFVKEIGLLATRCRFTVKNPAAVKRLALSMTYRGGFVAYLNGVEIARGSMPTGKINMRTAADPYPDDAFFAPDPKTKKLVPLHWWNHQKKPYHKHWKLRERTFGPVEVPRAALRKGMNVLAIELHRSEYPAGVMRPKSGLCFATIGLSELLLKADTPADNVTTALARPDGLSVWNAETWDAIYTTSLGAPGEALRPIRIAAARNGTFSGKVAVSSTAAIEGLAATATGLKSADGKNAIDLKHIRVRYGAVNLTYRGGSFSRSNGIGGRRFDPLLDAPPAKAELVSAAKIVGARKTMRDALGLPLKVKPAAVVPVWITIDVPKDAAPGEYRGSLAIRAKGLDAPVTVPVELSVSSWTLPDVKDYGSLIFIYQSPESLATWYKVKMWSEEHWKLIEKSLALMGGIGNIGLVFPFTAESCHGNPHTMVHWIKQADGSYTQDWTNFDRYLATAMKYHDPARIRVVAINVWGNEVRPARGSGKMYGALVTVKDPKTGALTNIKVPDYGTAECEAFWQPVLIEAKKRLAKYKVAGKLMFGVGNDSSPPPEHVAMFRRILPGTPWFRESHFNSWSFCYDAKDRRNKVVPVGCNSIVWGGQIFDPKRRRSYGWRHNPKHLILNFNRAGVTCLTLKGFPAPWSFRMWMESTLACGRNGNGRVGGDYFKLGVSLHKRWKGRRISSEALGGSGGTIYGSYPQSGVGQTGLGNNTTDLFAPGPNGPVSTARFENAREGNQESEARIVIEKALLAKALPAPLAKECQELLDDRTNRLRMWRLRGSIGSLGWQQSTRRLFDYAGKVTKALKKKAE
jgi:glycosyl hydrolase family 123